MIAGVVIGLAIAGGLAWLGGLGMQLRLFGRS